MAIKNVFKRIASGVGDRLQRAGNTGAGRGGYSAVLRMAVLSTITQALERARIRLSPLSLCQPGFGGSLLLKFCSCKVRLRASLFVFP